MESIHQTLQIRESYKKIATDIGTDEDIVKRTLKTLDEEIYEYDKQPSD